MTISFTPKSVLFVCATIFLLLFCIYIYSLIWYPKTQPESIFTVQSGDSIRTIAATADESGHIRSELAFLLWYRLWHSEAAVLAGQYQLPETLSLTEFVSRLTSRDISEEYTPLTFPEGTTIEQMASIIETADTAIDATEYQALLTDQEGYVFPDTYFVTEATTASELVALQQAALETALAPLAEDIAAHTLSERDIITLASIIEREANDDTSMRMVSGILQNRLAIGMALQADASMEYVLDKPLSELTPDDLKIDSPYNTYLYPGLPPTPISNPGLTAITAVLEPTETDNFYYITGRDGNFYYARTLDEHNLNIARYLR